MSLTFLLQVDSVTLQRLEVQSMSFTKPQLLRLYDFDHGTISVAKRCKYIRMPSLTEYPLDLNGAYDSYIYSEPQSEANALLTLEHIMTKSTTSREARNNITYDQEKRTVVYTGRGELRRIMQFCYSSSYISDTTLCIMRYDGHLYMFQKYDELREQVQSPEQYHHSRLCQHLFVDDPNDLPNLDDPFDESVVQFSLHKSMLGTFDITYACEAQGILSDERKDNCDDIDALNEKQFVIAKQMWSSSKGNDSKFLRYWIQAYLTNVDRVYMAYKDKRGIIHEPIQQIKTADIPENRYWKTGICTSFLNEFLERIEQLMSDVDSMETVYEIHFKKDKTMYYQIHEGNPEKIILPKEYMEFIRNKAER